MIPSNLISKGCVRRDGVHHGGEFSANGNRMSRKRGRRELEKARGIYATNRNLPEVPLYSLPSSLSSFLDLPIRLSAAFPRE